MSRRAKDLEPVPAIPNIPIKDPTGNGKTLRGVEIDPCVDAAILKEIEKQQQLLASKRKCNENYKNKKSGDYSGGNATKHRAGEKVVELIEAGELAEIKPKAPANLEDDPELLELFQSLAPEDCDIGISANRIQRARLICKNLNSYTREEKQLLVYPIVYQMHLYGYHRAEIAAILGTKPATVTEYIIECRSIYKNELLKEYTSEDRVAESLFLYDFVKKEALRKAAVASEEKASSYLRLAAQVESERNKLLETTGYFEKIKRANIIAATEDDDVNTMKRNSLVADVREIFRAEVSDD